MKKTLADGFYAAFDLGAHSVKAVLIERREGKERLAAIEEELLKPLTEFPGENEFREHQIQQVKQLSERLPLRELRECVAVLNHRELQVKVVEPPSQVQPDKLPEVLQWEGKKLLSPNYRTEPFLFSYRILRDSPPVALVAVIPQSILARYHEFFAAAGIELTGAYAEVFGCLALKEGSENTGMPALSIINLGHTGTHLQIFSAGELKFYRYIPSGCAEFSHPPLPAELEVFSQKIRFSFDYFRAVTKLGHIDELLFMGGGGALPEYMAFARDYFAPGKIGSLDISRKIDISPVLPQVTELHGPIIKHARLMPFLPALGAYWTHRDAGAEDCNLLGRFQNQLWKERMERISHTLPLWIGVAGGVILSVILTLWRISLTDQYAQLRDRTTTTTRDLTTMRVKISKLHAARTPEIRLAPRDKSALQPLLHDQFAADEVLYLIDQTKPAGVRLQKVLVQSQAQAENEMPEEEAQPEPAAGPGDPTAPDGAPPDSPPPPAMPAVPGPEESEAIEDLGGEILVLQGTATGYEPLAAFAEGLTKAKVLRRYRIIKAATKGSQEMRFILKGELP